MGKMLLAYGQALSVMKKDKIIILFSLVPVLVGAILFYFLGDWVVNDVSTWGKQWIEQQVGSGGWSSFFSYLLIGILWISLFFVINWFFVLVVSIIASPFNDAISNRVEKQLHGEPAPTVGESFGRMAKNFVMTLFNEVKKVLFIVVMTLLAFALSFIPMLVPISIALSAVLLAVGFLDYSWSRHNMQFRECLGDLRKSLLSYGISGGIFMAVIAVPIINLFVLPYATTYYTIMFCHKRNNEIESVV